MHKRKKTHRARRKRTRCGDRSVFDAGDHFSSVFPACCQDFVTIVPCSGPGYPFERFLFGRRTVSDQGAPRIRIVLCLHCCPSKVAGVQKPTFLWNPKNRRSTIGEQVAPQERWAVCRRLEAVELGGLAFRPRHSLPYTAYRLLYFVYFVVPLKSLNDVSRH